MGMEFYNDSANGLILRLERAEERTSPARLAMLRRLAKRVMESSQKMCPVDKHNLEDAHHLVEHYGDRNRIEIDVEVGGVVDGVDVDAYATYMHEGEYNLGPQSQLKQAVTGEEVGPKFLERALIEHEAEADDIIDTIMEALL